MARKRLILVTAQNNQRQINLMTKIKNRRRRRFRKSRPNKLLRHNESQLRARRCACTSTRWRNSMRYALVAGQREEAWPDLKGACPYCKGSVISKCGHIRFWHWAHIGERKCDIWWEPETPWHRGWKGHFPNTWQEAIHFAPDGEKHIADVKTQHGLIIEFQSSFLGQQERLSAKPFTATCFGWWTEQGASETRSGSSALSHNGSA